MGKRKDDCKARIAEAWKSRRADFRAFMRDTGGTEETGSFYEYGLSFGWVSPGTFTRQRSGFYEYLLSWGGPSDMVRFHPRGGKGFRVEYRFHDWFDGAGKDITGTKVADWLIDTFSEVAEMDPNGRSDD